MCVSFENRVKNAVKYTGNKEDIYVEPKAIECDNNYTCMDSSGTALTDPSLKNYCSVCVEDSKLNYFLNCKEIKRTPFGS